MLNGSRSIPVCLALAGAIAAVCAPASADYQDDLYFPFVAGDASVFVCDTEETEYWDSVPTSTGGYAGRIEKYRIEESDEVIFGVQMTHAILEGEQQQPQEGEYYRRTEEGILKYTYNENPMYGDEWGFWDDGTLAVPASGYAGDSFDWESPSRGSSPDPDAPGGVATSSGTSSGTITILGTETVTVPAGTFRDALKIRGVFNGVHVWDHNPDSPVAETSDNTCWLAKGIGMVRMEGYNTDASVNGLWSRSGRLTWQLVAFKRAGEPDLPGQTQMDCEPSGYASSGDPDQQQAVADAMAAVTDSMQTFQGGMKNEDADSYGCLAGVLTMDADAVDEAIAAMAADGASPQEQFIRIEFAYDESELSALGLTEADLAPYWWDADRDAWVVGGTTIAGETGAGTLATLPDHENGVGYYGVDTESNVIWANVNHASMYGIGNVPEPATVGLLALGGGLVVLRRRRSASRRAAGQ